VISFLLGMGYLIFGFFSLILRSEMPWIYRIATQVILKPSIWIYSRFIDKEVRDADKQDIAEVKAALAEYHARVDREIGKIKNGHPTQDSR